MVRTRSRLDDQRPPLVDAGLVASSFCLAVLQPSLDEVYSGFGRSQSALGGKWLGSAVALTILQAPYNARLGGGEHALAVRLW